MSSVKWIFAWTVSCFTSCVFGKIFVQTSYNLTSENYPENYPNNNTATWTFETVPNERLLLRFSQISTERIFDYISVGDGSVPSTHSRLLRWSGEDNAQELAVLSFGNNLWMTFQTDISISRKGFAAVVERVTTKSSQDILDCNYRCGDRVCLTANDTCDGLINCVDGVDENCTDHVFVDSTNALDLFVKSAPYTNNYRFTWYFETNPGFQLLLQFNFIYSEVNLDFVIIGEGNDVSSNKLLTWSGDSDGNMVQIISATNSMWMVLSTDETKPYLNFTGSISKRNVSHEGWKCPSNVFNCSENVCIPDANQCDGVIQCPDGADERFCSGGACSYNLFCSDNVCLPRNGECSNMFNGCSQDTYGCSENVSVRRPYEVQVGNFSYTYNMKSAKIGRRLVLSLQLFTREDKAFSLLIEGGDGNSTILMLKGDHVPVNVITVHSLTNTTRLSFTTEGGLYFKVGAIATVEDEFNCGTLNAFQCSPGVCLSRELVRDGREDCLNGIDEAYPPTEAACEECYDPSIIAEELGRIAETNLTDENVQDVAKELKQISGQVEVISAENLESIISSVENIVQFGASEEQVVNVTDSVVAIANNIMEVSNETLNHVTDVARVPLLLEQQATTLHLNGQNYSEIQENVGVSTIQIHEPTPHSNVTFGTFAHEHTLAEDNFRLSENNTGFRERFGQQQPRAAITLPSLILESIEKSEQNSSKVPLSFLVYRDATLFPVRTNLSTAKTSRVVISSHVISATVAVQNMTVNNLPNNSLVIVEFYSPEVAHANEESTSECVFWKYDPNVAQGEWSSEGCNKVTSESSDRRVVCACNHLTSFAVLVRIVPGDYTPSPRFVTVITTIGCILSVTGLCICIVVILWIKPAKVDKRIKQQSHIHLNLCIALLGLYLTFLIGIDRTKKSLGCRLTASSIHFFCLSSMTWMSVEAFNMFMLFWKMRRTHIRYLTPIAVAFAWGIPFTVTLLLFFLDDTGNISDRREYCFLHPGFGLYFGFILPIFLLFLFNSIVFVLVTYRVTCRKIIQTSEDAKKREIIARVKGSVLFWILLGMCWTFGVLAVILSPLKILFDILFSICLALQGVFMFVLLVLNNPEIEKTYTRIRTNISESYSSRFLGSSHQSTSLTEMKSTSATTGDHRRLS